MIPPSLILFCSVERQAGEVQAFLCLPWRALKPAGLGSTSSPVHPRSISGQAKDIMSRQKSILGQDSVQMFKTIVFDLILTNRIKKTKVFFLKKMGICIYFVVALPSRRVLLMNSPSHAPASMKNPPSNLPPYIRSTSEIEGYYNVLSD